MTMPSQADQIQTCLSQTLDPINRKQAEDSLKQLEQQPLFGPTLLGLIQSCQDGNIRFAASVYFKNYVKQYWHDVQCIGDNDRIVIKQGIIDLMVSLVTPLQLQLSQAVSLIAAIDFPSNWQSLISDLVGKLSVQPADLARNVGVLMTCHDIFKRWRSKVESNDLYAEINFVMGEFAPSYLQFFTVIDSLVDSNASNADVLGLLLENVLLLCKIFYSLNSQDLPEFFEDNMANFMSKFSKYLVYQSPLFASSEDVSVVERIKAQICESLELYADRYEADFKDLPKFVEIVWGLLTTTSIDPKNDVLVAKAVSFLTAVVRHKRHKGLFESPGVLSSICTQVVLPNMTLRESDEELFEDDPMEYIRRDLQGSDSDTRRRASADLVRGLLALFEKQVTDIFSAHIGSCLQQYHQDPRNNWRAKDTALYLITSLSAKTLTAQSGATSTNEYIQILPVFMEHIVPDLRAPLDGSVHPIIKVDAIKYLMLFRNQFTKEHLLQVLPQLIDHLSTVSFVVNTWAAHCIERILAMKQNGALMFGQNDIAPLQKLLLERLLALIVSGKTPAKIAENEYLSKCVLRVVLTSKEGLATVAPMLLERLSFIITTISQNPSNPHFNHFAFESLSSMVKFLCQSHPALVKAFETSLAAPFQDIIAREVAEFMPYVFQIYAQLLELHTGGIPQQYTTLLVPLLQPNFWNNQGNVPALVNFLSAFLSRGILN